MKRDFPKRVKVALQRLAAVAHDREMTVLVKVLAEPFAQWKRGEIDSLALAAKLDAFSTSHSKRRLRERYETRSNVHMNVAAAIVRGILRRDEVPKEVLEAIAQQIEYYREGLADGTISFDDEED